MKDVKQTLFGRHPKISKTMVLFLLSGFGAVGQTNNWTKASDGYWEEPYWTSGRLPEAGDTVVLANPGEKTVTIGESTMEFYSGGFAISDLRIIAPEGSRNALLLNPGMDTELGIESFTLGPSAAIGMLSGGLVSMWAVIGKGDTAFRQPGAEPLFTQADGEVLVQSELIVGKGYHGSGVYHLAGGWLSSAILRLGANRDAGGTFEQSGGTNVTGRLLISQEADDPMTLPDVYARSGYFMTAGQLTTSETRVGDGREGIFRQSGGMHEVRGILSVNGSSMRSSYTLQGGTLQADSIQLNYATFAHSGGILRAEGGISMAGCEWLCMGGQTELGSLQLTAGSRLVFGTNESIQSWGDSSKIDWSTTAVLRIDNWNGSLFGGGWHQVNFGRNPSGLTVAQLSQIVFANPGCLPAGLYPARILASGEVVPNAGPLLSRQAASAGIPVANVKPDARKEFVPWKTAR